MRFIFACMHLVGRRHSRQPAACASCLESCNNNEEESWSASSALWSLKLQTLASFRPLQTPQMRGGFRPQVKGPLGASAWPWAGTGSTASATARKFSQVSDPKQVTELTMRHDRMRAAAYCGPLWRLAGRDETQHAPYIISHVSYPAGPPLMLLMQLQALLVLT